MKNPRPADGRRGEDTVLQQPGSVRKYCIRRSAGKEGTIVKRITLPRFSDHLFTEYKISLSCGTRLNAF
jgi:hypothetical protein